MPSLMVQWCVHVCVLYISRTTSWGSCDHACMCMHVCIFAWTTVCVRGRCEGFPSAWNEVLYSQWDATKRDREKRDRERGIFKMMERKRTAATKLFLKYRYKNSSSVLTMWLCSLFSQNAEQQQHQQHPCLQLQPHAQATNLVSPTCPTAMLSTSLEVK